MSLSPLSVLAPIVAIVSPGVLWVKLTGGRSSLRRATVVQHLGRVLLAAVGASGVSALLVVIWLEAMNPQWAERLVRVADGTVAWADGGTVVTASVLSGVALSHALVVLEVQRRRRRHWSSVVVDLAERTQPRANDLVAHAAAITTSSISANGISANGISANGISANGISANGIGANGVTGNDDVIDLSESEPAPTSTRRDPTAPWLISRRERS